MAAYVGSVSAVAIEHCAVMAASHRFLPAYLLDLLVENFVQASLWGRSRQSTSDLYQSSTASDARTQWSPRRNTSRRNFTPRFKTSGPQDRRLRDGPVQQSTAALLQNFLS